MQKTFLILSCFFLWGCITDYESTVKEKTDDLLVVEGIITNDSTFITLSKCVGLNEYAGESVFIEQATLYVECDDETKSPVSQYIGKGVHRMYTGALNPEQKYRLKIFTGENEYESEFLTPIITPEIDSISWIKKGKGEQVHICVSTHDPLNRYPYYLWSYKEEWEFTALLYASAYYADGPVPNLFDGITKSPVLCNDRDPRGPIIQFTSERPNDRFYCWDSDQSKNLLLGSTEKLTEKKLTEKKLLTKDPDDRRWSQLYRIHVRQNMIRKEAYDYYSNLQKNVEQTGSIFSPIPSEMKGNITCVTNPDLRTIGYVEVSVPTEKIKYIRRSDGIYEPTTGCPLAYGCMPMQVLTGTDESNVVLAPLECVDCREFGTKKRPDNWPNDHQ